MLNSVAVNELGATVDEVQTSKYTQERDAGERP